MLSATALKGNLDLSQPYKPANLNPVCPQYANLQMCPENTQCTKLKQVKKPSSHYCLFRFKQVTCSAPLPLSGCAPQYTGIIKPRGFATSPCHRTLGTLFASMIVAAGDS